MNILLPNVDAIDAAEEICNRFDIPVVFLTAHTDERTIQRAKLTCPLGAIYTSNRSMGDCYILPLRWGFTDINKLE